jgi:hypothetical protein
MGGRESDTLIVAFRDTAERGRQMSLWTRGFPVSGEEFGDAAGGGGKVVRCCANLSTAASDHSENADWVHEWGPAVNSHFSVYSDRLFEGPDC